MKVAQNQSQASQSSTNRNGILSTHLSSDQIETLITNISVDASFRARLRAICFKLGNTHGEDLFQDAVTKLFAKLRNPGANPIQLDQQAMDNQTLSKGLQSKLVGSCATTARNIMATIRQKQARHEELDITHAPVDSQSILMDSQERQEIGQYMAKLERAIKALPEDQQSAIRGFLEGDGQSAQQVSAAMKSLRKSLEAVAKPDFEAITEYIMSLRN